MQQKTSKPRFRFLTSGVERRLAGLRFLVPRPVRGRLSGLHSSDQQGASVEFSEHKEYSPGDDLRHLNWRAYARTDKYYVRQFTKDTHVSFYIVVDYSSSMKYLSEFSPGTKLEYACRLATALSYVLLHQDDAVGLLTVRGSRIRDVVPPSSHASHLVHLAEVLERVVDDPMPDKGEGATDLICALEYLVGNRVARSGLVLLSDLFLDVDRVAPYLAYLASQGNYCWLAHILDPAEYDLAAGGEGRTLPFGDTVVLRWHETSASVLMDCQLNRREYQARFREYLHGVGQRCAEAQVHHHLVNTDTDPVEFLIRSLMERRR